MNDVHRQDRSVAPHKRFLRFINTRFVTPRVKDPEIRNREIVLNVLLVGTISIFALATLMLIASYAAGHTYVLPRIGIALLLTAILCGIYRLARTAHFRAAAHALLAVYILLAGVCSYQWGIDLPAVILLYALIITMAGVLLGARYSLYTALLLTIMISWIGYGIVEGAITPDRIWTTERITISSIIGFCLVFAIISLVNWLFNYQMDRSLHRALRAENALMRQKVMLEVQVEKRTREFQTEQLEKVQQMYRFAELGQLSTALLHELANHLTALNMDIEGLDKKGNSKVVERAKQSIGYIDDMVHQVQRQLKGTHENNDFAIDEEIGKVVGILQHKANMAGIQLVQKPLDAKQAVRYYGDGLRFRQILTNLVANAIDAYDGSITPSEHRRVAIGAENHKGKLVVSVTDWGKGIAPENLKRMFSPFYSTKQDGMGLGLFITKQLAEQHFGSTVTVESHHGCTTFSLVLKKA